MFDLSGRVVWITGAGRGVGAEIARTLARAGAAIAVNDLYPERAEDTAGAIRSAGGRAFAAVGDVTNASVVARLAAEISAALGPIDVLVHNAGLPTSGMRLAPFVETEPAEWRALIDLNLHAGMLTARAVLPSMLARRFGRVVLIVSDAARTGEPKLAAYSAAKAALLGFARSLAREVGGDGVTVNCIALGSIASERRDPDEMARLARRYPTGRLGRPDDVAPAVLYLASQEASWVTGQTVVVNGGVTTT